MHRSLYAAALLLTAACSSSSATDSASSDLSGSKASRGPTGPTGPTGPIGPAGTNGATGATGPADSLLPQSGSRLRAQREVAVGDDGATNPNWITAFWDTRLGAECLVINAGDGASRCLPSRPASMNSGYYADANCSTLLALGQSSSSDGGSPAIDPYAILGFWSMPGSRYFHLGAVYTGPFYQGQSGSWGDGGYTDAGFSCLAASPPAQQTAWLVGAELAPSEFVRFTVTRTQK
jgi:hypothetical protein